MDKLRQFYSSIKNGVNNLIQWFPIIWRDRDWDRGYIYILLHKKLEMMEEFFRSDKSYTASADEMANQMKLVKETLDRLIKDVYLTEETKEYDEKYGHLPLFEFEDVGNKGMKRLIDNTPKEAHDMFIEAGIRADKREQQDKEFVFDFMKENIDGWWD